MVNKKVVIICTIITVIVILSIIGYQIKLWREYYDGLDDTKQEPDFGNMIESALNERPVNETNENTVTQNDTNTTNTTLGEEEITGSENTPSSGGQDEAILLAKKEWGNTDETVYYTVDNVSENIYVVSVRSKSTTAQLAEYEVNLTNKTVTIR